VSPDPTDSVLNAFLSRYLADLETGSPAALTVYQAMFPGSEQLVEREYTRIEVERGAAPPGLLPEENHSIGPYRLLRELGRGGQGVVFLAEDKRLGRHVALKLLTQLGALSPEALARFRREALLASRLDDPGICTVYEAGVEQGVPFLAMRHVEGRTVARLLEEARRNQERGSAAPCLELQPDPAAGAGVLTPRLAGVVQLVESLARVLHRAHEVGIVHRDVKPGNVMVAADGRPVLLDFGLARAQDHALSDLSRTGDMFGTPSYMAPEQLDPDPSRVDRRADVYALGTLLYECVTLRRPFEAPTPAALCEAIRHLDPPDPGQFHPGLPGELGLVLQVAMAKDRDRRYRTALDLADDLRRVRLGEPILARPPSLTQRIGLWARRHRGLVASSFAMLVLAVVGLAVGAVLIWGEQARTAEREQLARQRLYAASMTLAFEAWERQFPARVRQLLTEQIPGPGQADLRGYEWWCLWRLSQQGQLRTLRGGTVAIHAIGFSNDGDVLRTVDAAGVVRTFDPARGELRGEVRLPGGCGAALSRDGAHIAVAAATGAPVPAAPAATGVRRWTRRRSMCSVPRAATRRASPGSSATSSRWSRRMCGCAWARGAGSRTPRT
jgi:serine/threonine protein kinase